jgi:hypothetical protein
MMVDIDAEQLPAGTAGCAYAARSRETSECRRQSHGIAAACSSQLLNGRNGVHGNWDRFQNRASSRKSLIESGRVDGTTVHNQQGKNFGSIKPFP